MIDIYNILYMIFSGIDVKLHFFGIRYYILYVWFFIFYPKYEISNSDIFKIIFLMLFFKILKIKNYILNIKYDMLSLI